MILPHFYQLSIPHPPYRYTAPRSMSSLAAKILFHVSQGVHTPYIIQPNLTPFHLFSSRMRASKWSFEKDMKDKSTSLDQTAHNFSIYCILYVLGYHSFFQFSRQLFLPLILTDLHSYYNSYIKLMGPT